MRISPHVTLAELTQSQTATRLKIDNTPPPAVVANLKLVCQKVFEPTRTHFGKPIRISSGYRSPKLNKEIGGAKNSQHTKGEALDLQGMEGLKNSQIFNYIKNNLDYDQLIWEYGTATEPAWVHVSFRKTGNRKQILTVK
jgi:hypothetical protein